MIRNLTVKNFNTILYCKKWRQVVDFYKDSSIGPPRDHKLAKDVVMKEMKKAGYRLIKSHTNLEQQYFLEFGL